MHTDGIGVDDVAPFAVAETNDSELLLQPAKQQSDSDSDDCSQQRNHPALHHEDAADLMLVRTQIPQRDGILLLVNDEHRERTDDVEAGNHQDERQKA